LDEQGTVKTMKNILLSLLEILIVFQSTLMRSYYIFTIIAFGILQQ